MKHQIYHGMNLRDAVKAARELGVSVEVVSGTGDYRMTHRETGRTIKYNNRRKDAPLAVTQFLSRLRRSFQAR